MTEPYFGWTMGETFAVIGTLVFLGGGWFVSWVVSLRSKRWSNTIAGYALLLTVANLVSSAMLWTTAWGGSK